MPTGANFPYGPDGPGDGTIENGVGENWANFASCLARNDGAPHGSAGWNHDMTTDTVTLNNNRWAWSMADVWWELDRNPITVAGGNKVVETIRNHQPMTTVKQFFVNYTNDHASVNVSAVKLVFRRHGYNTTGWVGRGGVDPNIFTGLYSDRKLDSNSNGLADFLIIDTEVNMSTAGTYYVYAYLASTSSSYRCFALNVSYLTAGRRNVSLMFDGSCIYRNRLNGSLQLVELYWEDENGTQYEYKDNPYNTTNYQYREFDFGTAATTGTYTDSGTDTNANGKYDCLSIVVQLNISTADNYTINGQLFDSLGNYIGSARNSSYLDVGTQTVTLRFDGARYMQIM